MRVTGAARDDAGMSSVRITVLYAGLCVALAAAGALAAGCGDPAAAPAVAPADVHLATDDPERRSSPAGAQSGAAQAALVGPPEVAPGTTPTVGDRLEAVRTVALYCALVDSGQFARASDVCARRRLWSRRALAGVDRIRFRSARVYAAPDARTLVLKARVRVRAGRGCPLPDGLAVLFFTLGRAGTTVGGWLITAVSSSP